MKRVPTVKTAIIFDCEFLCLEGSQRRFWCAAHDPDPVIAQIGAVELGLEDDFPLLGTHKAYVRPIDRFGQRYADGVFFTKLTGITEDNIETEGSRWEMPLPTSIVFPAERGSGPGARTN